MGGDTITQAPPGRRISFLFAMGDGPGVGRVEKAEVPGGPKRRYLEGVSSGLSVDAAGERMTERAVKGFHEQANSGDILLYAGKHGVDFFDDIGKLVHSSILPNGDWQTRYRIYDALDFPEVSVPPHIGRDTLERCDKIWKQVCGLPPYTKPKQKGFSVEGIVPDANLLTMDSTGRRQMDRVDLDGVLLVGRPAYPSVARAVYKALGIISPEDLRGTLARGLAEEVVAKADAEGYYDQYYRVQGALDERVNRIMNMNSPERADMLRTLFAEYGDLMVDLTMRSETVFRDILPEGSSVVRKQANGGSEPLPMRQVLVRRAKVCLSLAQKAIEDRCRVGDAGEDEPGA